jgi:A/G-specific adenine glycosylase
MLQQTTVAAVAARYDAFLARFPDVASLARAHEDSVLAAWSGLGYYARARNLHRAARVILARHGGRIPSDPAVLRELPGFGAYMAGAVAAIAFGVRAPAAEANVTRVLARLFRVGDPPGKARDARILALAAALLPTDRAGDVTAAWMDLGQQICLPRRPRCPECPVGARCEARRAGDPERYPVRRPRPPAREVHLAAAVARRTDGRVLVVRADGSLLSRLWRFPSAEADRPDDARAALAEELAAYGLELADGAPLGEARHAIMNRRISVKVYAVDATKQPKRPATRGAAGTARRPATQGAAGTARRPATQGAAGTAGRPATQGAAGTAKALRWMTPGELERAAIPTLTRRVAAAAGLAPGRIPRDDGSAQRRAGEGQPRAEARGRQPRAEAGGRRTAARRGARGKD